MLQHVGLGILALTLSVNVAASQSVESVYTNFNTKKCKKSGGIWTCSGHAGIPVRIAVGDERMLVSFGPRNKDDRAREQSLPSFNDVYEGTIEWRIEKPAGGKPRPFATILRWNAMTEKDTENATGPTKPSGRVLVVTRLGPGGVCHVGYVDAVANPDANELARKIADESARGFQCGRDKHIVLGKAGNVPLPKDEP